VEKRELAPGERLDDFVGPCCHDVTNLGPYLRVSPCRVRGQLIVHPVRPWIRNTERAKLVVIAHHQVHAVGVQQPVQHLSGEWPCPNGITRVIDGLAPQGVDRGQCRFQRRQVGVRIRDDRDPRHVTPRVG
jgi:hypothetical protein